MTDDLDKYRLMMDTPMTQDSELAAVIKLMNQDRQEPGSNLRQIDFLTRLEGAKQTAVTVHDCTIALNCLPVDLLMTTAVMKRNLVSLDGKGREEAVQMVSASMMRKMSMLQRFMGGNNGGQPL